MTSDMHALLMALYDTPNEYVEALSESGLDPAHELAEAVDG